MMIEYSFRTPTLLVSSQLIDLRKAKGLQCLPPVSWLLSIKLCLVSWLVKQSTAVTVTVLNKLFYCKAMGSITFHPWSRLLFHAHKCPRLVMELGSFNYRYIYTDEVLAVRVIRFGWAIVIVTFEWAIVQLRTRRNIWNAHIHTILTLILQVFSADLCSRLNELIRGFITTSVGKIRPFIMPVNVMIYFPSIIQSNLSINQ